MSGEYINTYNSINEAANTTNTNPSGISEVANYKANQANGYLWRFFDEFPTNTCIIPTVTKSKREKAVRCLNNGIVFEKMIDAAKWCGLSNATGIWENIIGSYKSAGKDPITGEKLQWEYAEVAN